MSPLLSCITTAGLAYVAFQLIPLPISWIAALSPAKADLIVSLSRVGVSTAFTQLAVNPSATLSHFARLSGYLLTFLLVRQFVWRIGPWSAIFPFLGIGVAEAFWGLLQCHYSGVHCDFATGTYINRNHFAGLLEMCFPFALVYAFLLIKKANRNLASSLNDGLTIAVFSAGALIVGAAVFTSLSRTGTAIIVASLSLLLAVYAAESLAARRRMLGLAALFILVVSVSFAATPWALLKRFSELGNPTTAALDRRIIWRQTIHLITDYPLFGCGLGGYASVYLKYKAGMPLWGTSFVHNDYLQGTSELGLVGIFIFGIFIACVLVPLVRLLRFQVSIEIRALALASGTSILCILIHGLVDFNFYIPANAMAFAWICGIAATLPSLHDNRVAHESSPHNGQRQLCGTSS